MIQAHVVLGEITLTVGRFIGELNSMGGQKQYDKRPMFNK